MSILRNYQLLQERIRKAAERVHRDPAAIRVVAVTKTVDAARIREAIACGITDIGENRVQEAWVKYTQIGDQVAWHMVGHLQTNKVKRAIQFFDLIHSVDSLHLANELSKRAQAVGKTVETLIQVNTSEEESKFGVEPDKALDLVKEISRLHGIVIKGLMTIGAFLPDPEQVRPCFVTLRELKEEIEKTGITMQYLSMGMSNDFEVAVEEGANLLRIGTAIFGPRPH